jgi:hypothetical protein
VKRGLIKRLAVSFLSACFVLFMLIYSVSAQSDQTQNLKEQDIDIHGGIWSPEEKIPFMKEARLGVLPNGLHYFILKNDTPKEKAFVMLAVNVGSVHEKDSERGIAHFVEHNRLFSFKRYAFCRRQQCVH